MVGRTILAADAVSNGVGLAIEQGGVCVSHSQALDTLNLLPEDTTVVAFGKLSDLKLQFPNTPVLRAGRAILPKPANAHTHLDLSFLPFTALPYFRWIPEVILANRNLRGLAAAQAGLTEASKNGALGDIVAIPEVMEFLLSQADAAGVAYWEVLDPNPDTAEQTFAATVAHVRQWRKLERPNKMRLGLSPHTPFTVSAKLLKLLANFAKAEHIPLQIHVAEHASELELFQTGRGGLADSLARMGTPAAEIIFGRAPEAALTPLNHLAELGVLEAKPTLVHMVNVTEADVRLVAQSGSVVVTCPRSNKNLECGEFNWKLFAKYGVSIGLGTDSVASGQTLAIEDEAVAALQIHAGLALQQVVHWATKGSHRALGLKAPIVQRGDNFSALCIWA